MESPTLVFNEETHEYTANGRVYPSVTQLLKKYGITSDFSKIPPEVLENARQRGVAVAEGRRIIVSGQELDMSTVDERIKPYLNAFRLFWSTSGCKLIETEVRRFSPLGFGFTCDLVVWIGGKRAIIDDKATHEMPKSVGPQTAAYAIGWDSLYPDQPIQERYGLHLRKAGLFKLYPLTDPDDKAVFLDILETEQKIERWRKKYE